MFFFLSFSNTVPEEVRIVWNGAQCSSIVHTLCRGLWYNTFAGELWTSVCVLLLPIALMLCKTHYVIVATSKTCYCCLIIFHTCISAVKSSQGKCGLKVSVQGDHGRWILNLTVSDACDWLCVLRVTNLGCPKLNWQWGLLPPCIRQSNWVVSVPPITFEPRHHLHVWSVPVWHGWIDLSDERLNVYVVSQFRKESRKVMVEISQWHHSFLVVVLVW